jgi:acetyltransferase-like isoleucine patch superfamily enzyme
MRFAGLSCFGRIATRLATWGAPPYRARRYLGGLYPHGYVAPSATIYHTDLQLGDYVFVGDRVMFFQTANGGQVALGERVSVYGDVLFETGQGGSITVGAGSRVHRGCNLIAYLAPIRIGRDVGIAQNCALYSYNHGVAPGEPISKQPLQTRGAIVIDDHVWLGIGVIVLSGVRIGKGAVIGAGSVVTDDIPDGAIAVGAPARVVKMRSELVEAESLPLEDTI